MSIHTETDFVFNGSPHRATGDATFEYETEFVSRDPQCGYFTDRWEITHLELINFRLGGLPLSRSDVEQIDKSELDAVEAQIKERLQEQLDAGEHLMAAE